MGGDLQTDWDVIVVGAGAAGLLAGVRAAERGRRTLLLEKNERAGVKILMSGGTRCNLTHATDARGIVDAFGPSGRFLHSALASLNPQELVQLIETEGVATKVESTGKIFPVSNRARDVLDALLRRLERSSCRLELGAPVLNIERSVSGFRVNTPQAALTTAKVIVTTGGQSYPGCGTTGDGYRWGAELGHTIIRPRPALVPVTVAAAWIPPLSGLTLPDVAVRVIELDQATGQGGGKAKTRALAQRRGSFLFTHFGLSGPVVLDVSREITGHPHPHSLALECDFLPESSTTDLEEWLKSQTTASGGKPLSAVLAARLPRRLAETLLELLEQPLDRRLAELDKGFRARLVTTMKQPRIPVTGTMGFKKAEVTAGGIPLDEVDSRTMESKRVSGLFLAGEVLDLDGPIGGYNFQAAFSTGWLAGESV